MSFAAHLYVKPDTPFQVTPHPLLFKGREVVSVSSDGLLIHADCWEDLQQLVVALHEAIAQARQAEESPASMADFG